jgi:hypothetical protein
LEIPICPQSLAILDVRVQCTAPDTVTQNFVLPIAERIESAFLATGRFEVVERNRIDAVQLELVQAQDDLWFDQTTVAKLGQFLGARYIALPTARINVGVFTTNIDLLVKVVDAERATTVETFEVKTSSASASVNSSLNNSLEKLPAALAKALRPVYPARAQAVKVSPDGMVLAETKSPRSFTAGEKVRLLKGEGIASNGRGTNSIFLVEVGRGKVSAVGPDGIVVQAEGQPEGGWIVEAMP